MTLASLTSQRHTSSLLHRSKHTHTHTQTHILTHTHTRTEHAMCEWKENSFFFLHNFYVKKMSLSETLRSSKLSLSFLWSQACASQSAIIARRHLLSPRRLLFGVEWNLGKSPEVKRGGQLKALIRCWRRESPAAVSPAQWDSEGFFVGTFTIIFTSVALTLFTRRFLWCVLLPFADF